ncbi:MAG: methyltransferase domain-containing protein [Terriglobales bacterium]
MRRVVIPEWLDSDAVTPHEVAASLADLRRINRWFGGIKTTLHMIRRVVRHLTPESLHAGLSLLDVGAGSGHLASSVAAAMQREGVPLRVTLLDRATTHFTTTNGMRLVAGDAMALPFRDASFDLVGCALLAHHLEPNQVVSFVEEALRVCRVAVLINDLRRSLLSLALVYAGFPLFRSWITRHDGPASVRRAYTADEMHALLSQTHAARVELSPHYLFRMGAIVWKGVTDH